jgi:hypothetical protein
MGLGDRGARELLAGVVVVAVGAGEIELAFASLEQRLALAAERREP